MKLNNILLFFVLILACPELNAQSYKKWKGRSEVENEVSVSIFGRNRYDINISIGYERNLFDIFSHSFISLQGK